MGFPTRCAVKGIPALVLGIALSTPAADPSVEQANVLEWRAQRLAELTGDTGSLTLAGLFWLKEGSNSFGSGAGNDLILNNAGAGHNGRHLPGRRQTRALPRPARRGRASQRDGGRFRCASQRCRG